MSDQPTPTVERRRDIGGWYAGPEESWAQVAAGFGCLLLIGAGICTVAVGFVGLIQTLLPGG